MSLRVLHLLHWPRSGIGSLLCDLVRLSAGRVEHHVVGLEGDGTDYAALREAGAMCEPIGASLPGPVALARLRARVRQVRPEVIHTHSFLPGLWARLVRADLPLVATVHNAYPYFHDQDLRSRMKRGLESAALRWRRARITCVSDGVLAALPAGWPAAEVVENGVMIERIRALAGERRRRTHGGGTLLVSAGRLEQQKGYDLLLSAFAQLRRGREVRLILVGEGSERGALEAQARRLGIADAVEFAGFVRNPFPLMRDADLYVSSSRYEGFGQAILESMSLGVPVVTTPTAGMGRVLRDGDTGFVASACAADALAEAVARALQDQRRLARVAKAGAALAEERYHLRRTSERYQAIYQEVLR
jgi:glycosyltransferase involved in cell wall biosynthesis